MTDNEKPLDFAAELQKEYERRGKELNRLLKKSVTPQDVVTTPQLELLHVVG